jgi:hypothetical protein
MFCAPQVGGAPVQVSTTSSALVDGSAVDGTQLYWFDTDGGVYGHAIDAPGGGPTLQGTTEYSIWNEWIATISADGLFWVDNGDPAILHRAPLTGGSSVTLYSGIAGLPTGLVVRGGYVYVSNSDGRDMGEPITASGQVRRVPVAGGESEVVAEVRGLGIASLAVDDDAVYFVAGYVSGRTPRLLRAPLRP